MYAAVSGRHAPLEPDPTSSDEVSGSSARRGGTMKGPLPMGPRRKDVLDWRLAVLELAFARSVPCSRSITLNPLRVIAPLLSSVPSDRDPALVRVVSVRASLLTALEKLPAPSADSVPEAVLADPAPDDAAITKLSDNDVTLSEAPDPAPSCDDEMTDRSTDSSTLTRGRSLCVTIGLGRADLTIIGARLFC